MLYKVCFTSFLAAWMALAQVSSFPEPPRPAGLPAPPHIFKLGQDYPSIPLKNSERPWTKYNFRTQPRQYLNSVLAYVLQGNAGAGIQPEDEWPGTANKVRPWYNVPWANREYIHGLTQERTAECGQLLSTGQKFRYSSWGVGFYNEPGGYTIGKVFPSPVNYDSEAIRFPEGTVATKILFSSAPVADVAYLQGSREWTAFLQTIPSPAVDHPGCPAYQPPCTTSGPGCTCAAIQTVAGATTHCFEKVHLLQLDVAVKDSRANPQTGWVFGTFVYNGKLPGNSPYDRLTPVGVAWGSDPPNVTPQGPLTQQYLFPDNPILQPGVGGRLNGMIDDPTSWCLGCHSTAEAEPPTTPLTAQQLLALGNIPSGSSVTKGGISLDYSLSVYDAIYNFLAMNKSPNPAAAAGTVRGPTGKPIIPIRR